MKQKPNNVYHALKLAALAAFTTLAWIRPAAAAQPADVDLAGNSIKTLTLESTSEPAESKQGCTTDRQLCIELVAQTKEAPPILRIQPAAGQGADALLELRNLQTDALWDNRRSLSLWPYMVQIAATDQGVMVGVREDVSTMYSGGGGSFSTLRLLQIYPKGAGFEMREVLALPLASSLMIRACFSERDFAYRRGACHDEYSFSSNIKLDRSVAAGFPRLIYRTRATSFPGPVSRSRDSLGKRLRKKDIATVVDQACTFQRLLTRQPDSGVYAPDKPMPACDEYLEP
ncbi:hypothetical protein JW897_23850 [Chromobacterium alkanivorans]|uniref:hypothetical protein n=1 Tax=Chromobacterium alkanivorans TaxID=1071719 RepID=UPI0019687D4C|nr:hypothetical protein [Chromobacterium alkanivorans]MBN3006777.1 hypothetical protein [Chromobacterium alkanivorans]